MLTQTPKTAQTDAHAIQISGLIKTFGTKDAVTVLDGIDLNIRENEFVSLVGRSGCGKTTLLNIIAGLEGATKGAVKIKGSDIKGPGQGQGVVFQQHALFPWMKARENVMFGFRKESMSTAEKRDRADELLELVGLSHAAGKYPREMSGGMSQRVAIARALALDPDILLMDEPFGALDELTRIDLQQELLRIWEARKQTVVFVTHSINEALMLSDRVILLAPHPGRIEKDLTIDLERPRRRTDPAFNALYQEIWEGLSA
jgi:ABC-type nitrate/sulfonate/bicarbonate transport system ATPase subunit